MPQNYYIQIHVGKYDLLSPNWRQKLRNWSVKVNQGIRAINYIDMKFKIK